MTVQLEWNNSQEAITIDEKLIEMCKTLLHIAASEESINDGEVALSFVDDDTIHELNKQYRNIDRPTDVLSFAMEEQGEEDIELIFDEDDQQEESTLLGDVIISVHTAIRQSEEYNHSLQREIGFLFVHGFLHLIGYDHEDEQSEKLMFAKQEAVLTKAGITR
ncbi:rRNA maturation RNase YbeY [Longirhabdus pacifica]|uniref:rRNA maturation RNase YbeY n=1 Tax=Longirhabdus pacifica TaxID=2305227 RepID=UPI001008DD8B|nr:rRNA maturation RNase YbeY [Longirhabdus pacifica]